MHLDRFTRRLIILHKFLRRLHISTNTLSFRGINIITTYRNVGCDWAHNLFNSHRIPKGTYVHWLTVNRLGLIRRINHLYWVSSSDCLFPSKRRVFRSASAFQRLLSVQTLRFQFDIIIWIEATAINPIWGYMGVTPEFMNIERLSMGIDTLAYRHRALGYVVLDWYRVLEMVERLCRICRFVAQRRYSNTPILNVSNELVHKLFESIDEKIKLVDFSSLFGRCQSDILKFSRWKRCNFSRNRFCSKNYFLNLIFMSC